MEGEREGEGGEGVGLSIDPPLLTGPVCNHC